DIDDHADRGRLAGPIRPDQPEHTPRARVEAELAHRREFPKTLAHPIQLYGCLVSGHLARFCSNADSIHLKRRRRSLISAQGSSLREPWDSTSKGVLTLKGFANFLTLSGLSVWLSVYPGLSLTLQPWAKIS